MSYEPMNVGKLRQILNELSDDTLVEIEVYDMKRNSRLFGPLWLAQAEAGELNLFARHESE